MNCRFPRPHASMRLFCFPWAGGGASFYTAWGEDITEDVEGKKNCIYHSVIISIWDKQNSSYFVKYILQNKNYILV